MERDRLALGLCVSLFCAGVATATTWDVDPTGSCSDATCAPCCTIQAAVEHSVGGDVVSVAAGTYVEQVDIRSMLTVGDLTLEAAAGPGTVQVAPTSGRSLTHADTYTNTVTIDGIDFTSPDMTCVFLAHSGNVALRDVTASGCGNHGFEIDATGTVSMERCVGTGNGNKGIQVDSASSVSLSDCTGSLNSAAGIHVLNVTGSVELTNPTATANADYGIGFDSYGPVTIIGGTVTDNGTVGVWPWVSATISIEGLTITGNAEQGIDIEGLDGVPVAGVTVASTTVSINGHGTGDSGFRLRDVEGPVAITGCVFDNNGWDGISIETSVLGDVSVEGGRADGNASDGYDLRNVGNLTVTGSNASGNVEKGFAVDSQATVLFSNCDAADNGLGAGFTIDWQDPEPVDGITITDCSATDNGLLGASEGFHLRHVTGPVSIVGSQATGNGDAGIALRDSVGTVFIRNVVTSVNDGDGIKLDAAGGPMGVVDSVVDGNVGSGVSFNSGGADVTAVEITRTSFTSNTATAIDFYDLSGPGPFKATCNDVVGNDDGVYLADLLTVDARHVWWGDPTGPSGQGPGAGDSIWADGGGTILHDPWLVESFAAPVSGCPFFTSGFESGSLDEWDGVFP